MCVIPHLHAHTCRSYVIIDAKNQTTRSTCSVFTRCGSAENEKSSRVLDGSKRRKGDSQKKSHRNFCCAPGEHIFFVFLLQDRKIDELKQSLLRYKKVQDMVMSVQGKKGGQNSPLQSKPHLNLSMQKNQCPSTKYINCLSF